MPEAYIYEAIRTPRANGKASGELYEDDGISFDYQQGKYRVRRFTAPGTGSDATVTERMLHDACSPLFGPIETTTFMSR